MGAGTPYSSYCQKPITLWAPAIVHVFIFHRPSKSKFWDSYCNVPIDVIWVKSHVDRDFPLRVIMGITISKVYFVSKRAGSGVVGVLLSGGGCVSASRIQCLCRSGLAVSPI